MIMFPRTITIERQSKTLTNGVWGDVVVESIEVIGDFQREPDFKEEAEQVNRLNTGNGILFCDDELNFSIEGQPGTIDFVIDSGEKWEIVSRGIANVGLIPHIEYKCQFVGVV